MPPARWLQSKLTLGDADAIVRPICERYILPDTGDDGFWRIAGVQMITVTRVEGARFRFRDLDFVADWRLHSDALSRQEREDFVSGLPTGRVFNVVTSQLPTLADSSSTTLQAIARFATEEGCRSPDWVTVAASGARVYHGDPSFITMRGMYFMVRPFHLFVAAVVLGAAVYYVIRRRRRTAA